MLRGHVVDLMRAAGEPLEARILAAARVGLTFGGGDE